LIEQDNWEKLKERYDGSGNDYNPSLLLRAGIGDRDRRRARAPASDDDNDNGSISGTDSTTPPGAAGDTIDDGDDDEAEGDSDDNCTSFVDDGEEVDVLLSLSGTEVVIR
jgi:hypothetical protein